MKNSGQRIDASVRRCSFWVAVLLIGGLFSGLGFAQDVEKPDNLQRHRFSAPHLGTVVHLVFYSNEEREEAARVARAAFQKVRELDAVFSDYREDSEVRKLGQKAIRTAYPVSDDLFTVLACAQKISAQSNGAFDITLGKETKRWREKRQGTVDPVPEKLKSPTNYRDLKLDPVQKTVLFEKPLDLDSGGIAKGYIADQVMLLLKKSGIEHAAVVIGGETVLSAAPPGKKGWRIGLEDPEHQKIGTLELSNTALSTSGDSYQFIETSGKREAHLIDPATRRGKSNRLNVTTIAPTAMQADAWATALRILPGRKALKMAVRQPGLEALFIPLGEEPFKPTTSPTATRTEKEGKSHARIVK